jgi:hypothetical protein
VPGVAGRGDVEQHEGELEQAPAGLLVGPYAARCQGHGLVGEPECLEGIFLARQVGQTIGDAVAGDLGASHQGLGRRLTATGQAYRMGTLLADPARVLVEQGLDHRSQGCGVGDLGQLLHRQGNAWDRHGLHAPHRALGQPGRAHAGHAVTITFRHLRRDAVPHRPLAVVAVLQVRPLGVRVLGVESAPVGSRNEARRAGHRQFGLEEHPLVAGGTFDRIALVDHEDRHRTGAGREPRRVGRDDPQVEHEARSALHRDGTRLQWHLLGHALVGAALPERRRGPKPGLGVPVGLGPVDRSTGPLQGLEALGLVLGPKGQRLLGVQAVVLAPARLDVQVIRVGWHQQGHAEGAGEPARPGSALVVAASIVVLASVEAGAQLLVVGRIAVVGVGGALGDQEAGEVPAGGA